MKKETIILGADHAGFDVKEFIKECKLENNVILKGEISSDKIKDLFPLYDFYFQMHITLYSYRHRFRMVWGISPLALLL